MTEVEKERYMDKIWMRALNKRFQKKVLVQKISTICTVMQNKFAGNLHNQGGISAVKVKIVLNVLLIS